MKMCVTWFNIYQIFPPLQIKHAHLCLCGVYLWSHLFASILNLTFSISKQDICWPQMWNLCLWLYTRINLHIIEIEQRKKTTVLSGRGLQISKQCLFAIWATAWKSCEYSTSTGRKGGVGGLLACVLTSGLLCTSNHKQRKWEKGVNRQRPERSFLASSSRATSLSSWLFVQTKAADNAVAAELTGWSRAAMKRPRGRWMDS